MPKPMDLIFSFPKSFYSPTYILTSVRLLLGFLSFAYLLFANNHNKAFSAPQCLQDHTSALLQLKQDFGFPYNATTLSSWNPFNKDCCSWEGITCDDATGHVIGLDLSSRGVSGRIDFVSIFQLHSLQRLNLADNYFDPSPIPPGFGQLSGLTHLNLSSLKLYGQIPLDFSHLMSLVSLDLSSSNYYGNSFLLKIENPNIQTLFQNLPSLRELRLDSVNISAKGVEWGQALSSSLPHLHKLSLSFCHLSSPIDSSLSKLHFLSELDLSGNNLSSAVPNFIGNFSSLTSLRLASCGLYGNLPESIFRLPSLQTLDVRDNPLISGYLPEFPQNSALQHLLLYETGLSGKLPDSISNLKFLSVLQLQSCNLSGSLPSSLGKLNSLVYLDLSGNNISGLIPSYGDGLQSLEQLKMYDNALSGNIPLSLFSLPSLRLLDFSRNDLYGQVGEFPNESSSPLEQMYLQSNKLEGQIPRSIFKLKKLQILNLSFNNLSGILDLNSFQDLKNLFYLDLSENRLSIDDSNNNSDISFPQIEYLFLSSCNISKFPSFLRSQQQLFSLDLSKNRITGDIPAWIWKFGNMFSLNLSHNALQRLEQPIPYLLLSFMNDLDISYNNLEGSFPIPPLSTTFLSLRRNYFSGEVSPQICNATVLKVLDLAYNNFSGLIPQCLSEMSGVLEVLNLRGNAFRGAISLSFKEECSLKTINLSGNQLHGQVPRSLANCQMLEEINIGNNQIHDTFPFWLESCSQLRILGLRSNKFYGSVQPPLTYQRLFPLIQIIDLSSNSFTGSLPSDMFKSRTAMMEDEESQDAWRYYQDTVTFVNKGTELNLMKVLIAFTSIDFSNNQFQGSIPESIGNLKALRALNLSNNHLSGQIPVALENLKVLEELDLSQNNLSGEIPWQLTALTFLSVLNLSQNNLSGSIPQSQQFLTFTAESFQGNEELCGPPLSKKCGDVEGSPPSVELERNSKWKFVLMGFGVGYPVGIGMLFWILALWKKGEREYYKFIDRIILIIFSSSVNSPSQQR